MDTVDTETFCPKLSMEEELRTQKHLCSVLKRQVQLLEETIRQQKERIEGMKSLKVVLWADGWDAKVALVSDTSVEGIRTHKMVVDTMKNNHKPADGWMYNTVNVRLNVPDAHP